MPTQSIYRHDTTIYSDYLVISYISEVAFFGFQVFGINFRNERAGFENRLRYTLQKEVVE